MSTLNLRGTPGVVPPFQKTPMSQSTPNKPDSPALTGLSPRVSTQNTVARVTALWHLERKSQIPMSTRQEACHYCYSSRGKWTCMSPQETRPDSSVETTEEPQVSYGNSKKKEILTSTKDEALFHCGISREIPPSLLSLERVLDTFYAT